MVKEPAESVEAATTVAEGVVAQVAGVPMVGAVVWVDLKWALVSVRLAKVAEEPATVRMELDVSSEKRTVPAAFWSWNAVVESALFWKVVGEFTTPLKKIAPAP